MKHSITLIGLACLSLGTASAQTPGNAPDKLQQGKQLYDYWCGTCHAAGYGLPGFGELPGTHQLRLKYQGTGISPILDERTDLVPEFVKVIVRNGISFMPHFRKTEINDAELDAIAAYLSRNNPALKK